MLAISNQPISVLQEILFPSAVPLLLKYQNPRWRYGKIEGELRKLGYRIGRSTIRAVLNRQHIPASPSRASISTNCWRVIFSPWKPYACKPSMSSSFSLKIGTRRMHLAGCTVKPMAQWVTQQARQLVWKLQEEGQVLRFLLHDRDAKFPAAFDAVFASESIKVILTPFRAPNANAYAERWVRSVREECLDHLLIITERHLDRVLREYSQYYNRARPHQGLRQQIPESAHQQPGQGMVQRRDVLGGLIHDYYRDVA